MSFQKVMLICVINLLVTGYSSIVMADDFDTDQDYSSPDIQSYQQVAYNNTFVFDPRHLSWGAYGSDGLLVKYGHASGGRGYCPDIGRRCHTPVGSFRVYSKGGAGCKSTKFPIGRGGAPMPYCMYFHSGFAVHGSYEVPNYNASHGCIRLPPADAQWLSSHFMGVGTRVVVKPY